MFGPFERAVAGRYLRARRGERFVSIIAIFSLVGIALGVATLIIVMSVMGGFKVDLLNRILGFNGHLGVYGVGGTLQNYDDLAGEIRPLPNVVSATPVLDGQVLLTGSGGYSSGGYVRGITQAGAALAAAGQQPYRRRLAGQVPGRRRHRHRQWPGAQVRDRRRRPADRWCRRRAPPPPSAPFRVCAPIPWRRSSTSG